MAKKISKMIITPIDGSENALISLNYLNFNFGAGHDLKVVLLYILPALPPILVDEGKKNRTTARKLKAIETKNVQMAGRILSEAKNKLLEKGFKAGRLKVCTVKRKKTRPGICAGGRKISRPTPY